MNSPYLGKSLIVYRAIRSTSISDDSQTAIVAIVIVLPSGRVLTQWLTHYPFIELQESLEAWYGIHGNDGSTTLELLFQKKIRINR